MADNEVQKGKETRLLEEKDFKTLIEDFRAGVPVENRRYLLKSYPDTFLGSDAVAWLLKQKVAVNEAQALDIGNKLLELGVFYHVTRDHPLKNEGLFYRFSSAEDGNVERKSDGAQISWSDILDPAFEKKSSSLQPSLSKPDESPEHKDDGLNAQTTLEKLEVSPMDEHNIKLLDQVHPAVWNDPTPKDNYNLVVIGAGAGGLVTAAGASGVGARVALIESNLLGGDCLNIGCVPSKALLGAAKRIHMIRTSEELGVTCGDVKVDFGKIMERMRKIRSGIARHDSAERFTNLGVDVFLGYGKFLDKHTVEVNGKVLKFNKAVIATGGQARVPSIPGIQDVTFLTNATVFNLTELPPRLAVIGAGPIGIELAQAFRRFGSEVTVFYRSKNILGKEEPEAAAIVQQQLEKEGVVLLSESKYESIAYVGDDDSKTRPIKVTVTRNGELQEIIVDALLVSAGRRPNVHGMGLEAAGVAFTNGGVTVNDSLQTSQKHIFAVGDCCSKYQFTHMADFMARTVIRNALFFGRGTTSSLIVPWATYSDPEVAHVGLYPRDCKEQNIAFDEYKKELVGNDRLICEGENQGYVRIICKGGTDQILGATIVGPHAGDLISEVTVCMNAKFGLGRLASVIHPYPTVAETIRQCGDLYNKTRLTPVVKSLFRGLMSFQR